MKLEEQIKVMKHFADGGEIENSVVSGDHWDTCPDPIWNWYTIKYRIKVDKPTKLYEVIICDRSGHHLSNRLKTQAEIDNSVQRLIKTGREFEI